MDLKTLDLLALQTKAMQDDKTTQGMCAALTAQFQQLANDTDMILLWSNIDNLPEDVLDELAWDLHLDYYDTTLPVENKRLLIKSGIIIHMTKGTPYAVKQLITAVFGTGQLVEWFQYGGQPYYFRVYVKDAAILAEKYDSFIKALDSAKNIRSHLDDVYAVSVYCGDTNPPVLWGAVCSDETYV